MYFLHSKDDTAEYFMKYLVDIASRKVDMVKNDEVGKNQSEFGALCTREKVKQELPTADTLEISGVVERQSAVLEAAGLAARIPLKRYPNEVVLKEQSRWAEQATATSANPKFKSPCEMWYGAPPQSSLPFLKPGCSDDLKPGD